MIYDLIVLGGGPGGYLAAERAGAAGLNTLLVEKQYLGGVCLNEGCIPTKTMLHSAKLLDGCKNSGVYGVTCENPVLRHGDVIARKDKVVRRLVAGVRAALRESHVEVVMGEGRICGSSRNGVVINAGGTEYTGKHLIIAIGSEPFLPPIPGLDAALEQKAALTSSGLLSLKELPARLAIIGGGVIGLEMAYYFSAAGSAVTVVELLPKIAGYLDEEISALLQNNMEHRGVLFRLGSKASAISGSAVTIQKDGVADEVPFDKLLVCVGRRPVIGGIGLESLSISAGCAGIMVDECCRTNIPGVFAVGDCTGRSLLAHTAYRQAEVAVNTILGRTDSMSYRAIPSVIYTHPEAASVGLTGEAAQEQGIDAETVILSMNYSGRYQAEQERGDGICKLIFDRKHRTLAGAHILGGPASELIVSCGMLIEAGIAIDQMKKFVFPHPTVSEIIREGIFMADL